tara:strand:- start:468 stop:941 length:474 start_codon:yes stop_codon:yes gene_type:complete
MSHLKESEKSISFNKYFSKADHYQISQRYNLYSNHIFFTITYEEKTPNTLIESLSTLKSSQLYIWDCFNVEHIERPGRKKKRGRKPYLANKPNPNLKHLHGILYCQKKDYSYIKKYLLSFNTLNNLKKSKIKDIFNLNNLLWYIHNGHHITYKNYYL